METTTAANCPGLSMTRPSKRPSNTGKLMRAMPCTPSELTHQIVVASSPSTNSPKSAQIKMPATPGWWRANDRARDANVGGTCTNPLIDIAASLWTEAPCTCNGPDNFGAGLLAPTSSQSSSTPAAPVASASIACCSFGMLMLTSSAGFWAAPTSVVQLSALRDNAEGKGAHSREGPAWRLLTNASRPSLAPMRAATTGVHTLLQPLLVPRHLTSPRHTRVLQRMEGTWGSPMLPAPSSVQPSSTSPACTTGIPRPWAGRRKQPGVKGFIACTT
mmetsp:Transcript_45854/g.146415  ORF Transcript_45854/g.146415 Transcript_45854/m.146415 type:complete len:274 (-) Transcript_45854:7-828(-)